MKKKYDVIFTLVDGSTRTAYFDASNREDLDKLINLLYGRFKNAVKSGSVMTIDGNKEDETLILNARNVSSMEIKADELSELNG